MKNRKHRNMIYSCVLALCLIGTLVVSGTTLGVRAEDQTAETQIQETQQETSKDKAEQTQQDTDKTPAKETKKDTKASTAKQTAAGSKQSKVATQASMDWNHTSGSVTVAGNGTDSGDIQVAKGSNEDKYTGKKSVVFDYNISAANTVNGELNISVADCGIMSDDDSVEIWYINGSDITKISADNVEVTEGNVSFSATELGEYIAVSNVATADLAKGNVTVSESKLTGKRQDGGNVSGEQSKNSDMKYRVSQSKNETRVSYMITFSGDINKTTTVIVDGINTTSSISIPACDTTKVVKLRLRNVNQVHHIYYGTGIHEKQSEEVKNNDDSKLNIESYDPNDDSSGELYIPYKMKSHEEEIAYVSKTSGADTIGSYWALAGIGGDGYTNNCTGLTISSGTLRVLGQNANGSTAIGGGGNGDAQIKISGGNITAICSSTGSAIGGGIGWVYRGGVADVDITGGTIYAENMGYYTRSNRSYGGVAIGSGSSTHMYGSQANITISGNSEVTAYARYGNGIGSGNSYMSAAANANINISGNSKVKTNALGGGTSKENQGGSADITIKGNPTVDCIKYADITEKWDSSSENILGAFGIGGGNSADTYNGGKATVNVYGGKVNCNGGNIGGGNANDTGNGGDASIYVTGGTLDCASIGGGNSVSGKPGAVNSDDNPAGVTVTGGTVKTGTIGGGTNDNDDIGFATADISGGTIQGQFILANTDSSKKCTFNMTGGTINNSGLGSDKYARAQDNGGAVYLTDDNGEVTLAGGTIKSSHGISGGAIYLAGTNGKVSVGGTTIEDCYAENGGAVYMTSGEFTLAGDSDKGGIIQDCKASSDGKAIDGNGGAVYLEKGSVTASGGTIGVKDHPNKAVLGGGIYLASGTMDIAGGTVAYNSASSNGGGAYLDGGTLIMTSGKLDSNTATASGGGAYVSGGNFKLNGKDAAVSSNTAKNGAGIYLTGGTPQLLAGSLTANTASENGGGIYIDKQDVDFAPTGTVTVSKNTAVNGGGVYIGGTESDRGGLSVDKNSTGSMQFMDNIAKQNGGGACVDYGSFELDSDKVTMQGNSAANGGGVAVINGSFTQNGGTIGGSSSKPNKADNGGAVYVSGGNVTFNDGKIQNNSAENGGGIFASEGKVRMFGGSITSNTATADGGGIYVSSAGDPADVVLRSGTLSSNTAGNSDAKTGNGGGLAVVSSQGSKDHVIIGLNEKHPNLDFTTRKFDAFNYDDTADDNKSHDHASCMIMENNLANGNGGGIYMGSTGATLDIYCLLEKDNESKGNKYGGSVMATGGQVNIGDSEHNNSDAGGNIVINTPMLVSGGDVDIWGNMKNPYFENNILVDIQENAGTFEDHRTSTDESDHHYKVQYFENFFGSGMYSAIQYSVTEKISAEGTLYAHEGYKIVEWNTSKDGKGTHYPIGSEIGSATNHSAWKSVDDPLILYAIWEKIKYTVEYEPNATGDSYSGSMADQLFTYGEEQKLADNGYKVSGKRFNGWKDKTGADVAADYSESKLSKTDGDTVHLYAQWVDCTHNGGEHPGTITYVANDITDTITEMCDCDGHNVTVSMSGANVYHDGSEHPVTVSTSGGTLFEKYTLTYQYSDTKDGTYGALADGETVPKSAGYYKAVLSLGDKTVTLAYQIKNPSANTVIDAAGTSGQTFRDFNGSADFSAPRDDAFTLQYDIQKLNTEAYQSEPELDFGRALPSGTTVIMQKGGTYWYCSNPAQKIKLSDFIKMGGSSKYKYTVSEANQKYRFIIDFSKVSESSRLNENVVLDTTFVYKYTANPDTDPLTASVKVTMASAGVFSVGATSVSGVLDGFSVTAPAATETSRWYDRTLVLRITPKSGTELPSDARLTVKLGDKTSIYYMNSSGRFDVPLDWSTSQIIGLSLDSDLTSACDKDYSFDAELYTTPSAEGKTALTSASYDTGKSSAITLHMNAEKKPSVKITGQTDRVLSLNSTLDVAISTANTDGCSVSATIQQKDGKTYSGNFLDAKNISPGKYDFSLGGIKEKGSYRLLVTVTENQQTVLTVPYYFIVN